MPGDRMAVILAALWLLERGFVDGLLTEYACNNGMCRNLEGFGELALVRDRAQVVCGGCSVARYCCMGCSVARYCCRRNTCQAIGQFAGI